MKCLKKRKIKKQGRKMKSKAKNGIQDASVKKKKTIIEDDDVALRLLDGELDDDENIQLSLRSNKGAVYCNLIVKALIPFVILFAIIGVIFLLPGDEITMTGVLVGTLLPLGLLIVTIVLACVLAHIYNKNALVVLTNKTIIKRAWLPPQVTKIPLGEIKEVRCVGGKYKTLYVDFKDQTSLRIDCVKDAESKHEKIQKLIGDFAKTQK